MDKVLSKELDENDLGKPFDGFALDWYRGSNYFAKRTEVTGAVLSAMLFVFNKLISWYLKINIMPAVEHLPTYCRLNWMCKASHCGYQI